MWTVNLYHFNRSTLKGGTVGKEELVSSLQFKTKKSAKEFIYDAVANKQIQEKWRTGDKSSYVFYFTGLKWQNENSGEMEYERYSYIVTKTKAK